MKKHITSYIAYMAIVANLAADGCYVASFFNCGEVGGTFPIAAPCTTTATVTAVSGTIPGVEESMGYNSLRGYTQAAAYCIITYTYVCNGIVHTDTDGDPVIGITPHGPPCVS